MVLPNLADLQPQKAPSDARDYSMMVIGESKIGKTTFVSDFYGKERTLFIATEDRHKALAGAYVVRVSNWSEFEQMINRLGGKDWKEKFDYIVIDTVDNLYNMLETYVTSRYRETILGQSDVQTKFSEDYRYLDTLFKKIKRINDLGYITILISHAVKQYVNVQWGSLTPEEQEQLKSIGIDESDRDKKGVVSYPVWRGIIKKDSLNEFMTGLVDNVLFLTKKGLNNQERVIQTRKNMFNDCASSTFKNISSEIPLNAEAYRKEIEKCIDGFGEEVDKEYKPQNYTLDYQELYNQAKEIGQKLLQENKGNEIKKIARDILGEGQNILDLKEDQVELLKHCVDRMEGLLGE